MAPLEMAFFRKRLIEVTSTATNVPITRVMMVKGAPTLKYLQKPIATETVALCMTIRLAIEPSTVRLADRVEAIDIASHALSCAFNASTNCLGAPDA